MHEQFAVVWQILAAVSEKCASLQIPDANPASDRDQRRCLLEHRAFAVFLFSHALICAKQPQKTFATSLELCTLAVEAEFAKTEVEGQDLWSYLGVRANQYGTVPAESKMLADEIGHWSTLLGQNLAACQLEGPLMLRPPIVVEDVVAGFLSRADVQSKLAEFYVPLFFVPTFRMLQQLPDYLEATKDDVERAMCDGFPSAATPVAQEKKRGFISRIFRRN